MEWVTKNMDGSGHGPGNLDWHGNGAGTVQYFTGIQTGRVFGNRPVEASDPYPPFPPDTHTHQR